MRGATTTAKDLRQHFNQTGNEQDDNTVTTEANTSLPVAV
jgi:hypothetical protein